MGLGRVRRHRRRSGHRLQVQRPADPGRALHRRPALLVAATPFRRAILHRSAFIDYRSRRPDDSPGSGGRRADLRHHLPLRHPGLGELQPGRAGRAGRDGARRCRLPLYPPVPRHRSLSVPDRAIAALGHRLAAGPAGVCQLRLGAGQAGHRPGPAGRADHPELGRALLRPDRPLPGQVHALHGAGDAVPDGLRGRPDCGDLGARGRETRERRGRGSAGQRIRGSSRHPTRPRPAALQASFIIHRSSFFIALALARRGHRCCCPAGRDPLVAGLRQRRLQHHPSLDQGQPVDLRQHPHRLDHCLGAVGRLAALRPAGPGVLPRALPVHRLGAVRGGHAGEVRAPESNPARGRRSGAVFQPHLRRCGQPARALPHDQPLLPAPVRRPTGLRAGVGAGQLAAAVWHRHRRPQRRRELHAVRPSKGADLPQGARSERRRMGRSAGRVVGRRAALVHGRGNVPAAHLARQRRFILGRGVEA